jgi:hypothetical protein
MKLSFEAAQTEIKTNLFFGQSQANFAKAIERYFSLLGKKSTGANRTFAAGGSIDIE